MAKCKKVDCKQEATDVAVLYGRSVSVCVAHKRLTDLGNWQGIEFTEQIDCRKCGDSVEVPVGKNVCYQCV